MKTKNLLLCGFVALAFLATSCEEKTENAVNFSPLTVEQNKANIEDNGLAMVDDMKAMENEPAIQTNITLAQLLDTDSPMDDSKSAKIHPSQSVIFAPVYATANYKQNGMKGLLKTVMVNPAEDSISIQAAYNELVGIHEWNAEYQEWNYTQTGSKIVFKFPSEENGTTNNATYTVAYTGYTGPNPIKDEPNSEYTGDLPQNISAKLVVDAVEISAYLLDIVYGTDGIPTSIETSLSLGDYKLSAMAANASNKNFNTEASFTNGSKILLKFVLGASGDWNQANIDANTHYYIRGYNQNTGEWVLTEVSKDENYNYEENDFHKVIKNGNASFQVMNLKVVGNIEAEKLGDKIKEIEASEDFESEEDFVNAEVSALNSFVSLSLRYADSDQVIALVEAYPMMEEDSHETDYSMDFRFIFADGSKNDFELYFSDSFTELENSLLDWKVELEKSYGNSEEPAL